MKVFIIIRGGGMGNVRGQDGSRMLIGREGEEGEAVY